MGWILKQVCSVNEANTSWPKLREELDIFSSAPDVSGAPGWSIYDPVRNLYFRIDWLTFEILRRWTMADEKSIVEAISKETTLHPSPKAVAHVLDFLARSELVNKGTLQASMTLTQSASRRQAGYMKTLIHNYLFFRIPLWKPDRWLEKTKHWFNWCRSDFFKILTILATVLGVFEISRQWEKFSTTLVDFISLEGLLAYAVTLIVVKFFHELGHAYSAKRRGCRVPTMGVAFLVLFPMAYTDVNDVWRLPHRRDRLVVGGAGILTELTIAAWASLVWSFLPDGPLRTGAFLLASTTWISSLFINASPFLRFDGYFLLMDWLDIPNLHSRSFILARWQLRKWLFRMKEPLSEVFSVRRHRFMVLFALLTWIYRLVVFLGIAVLVYITFPKPLGPMLAGVEITWFILMPIKTELKRWLKNWEAIIKPSHGGRSIAIFLLVVFFLIVPWDTRVGSQGMLVPELTSYIVTPEGAQIVSLNTAEGSKVSAGQVVATLKSPDLENEILMIKAGQPGLVWQQGRASFNEELRAQANLIYAEQEKVATQLIGLENMKEQFTLTAPHEGIVHWFVQDMAVTQWLPADTIIAEVANTNKWHVNTYLTETDLARVKVRNMAKFFPESGFPASINMKVIRIDSDATRILPDPILANVNGGSIIVRELEGQLIPEQAIYRVTLAPAVDETNQSLPISMNRVRGKVVIFGETRSWASGYLQMAMAIVRREFGF